MTFETMIALYDLLSASHLYILGFVFDEILYYAEFDLNGLKPFLKMDRASSARGGFAKIRVKMSAEQKRTLAKTAIACGIADDLLKDSNHNRGENFERIITKMLTGKEWKKDSLSFNKGGDINWNGKNVQIKLDNAELTNEKILKKLTGR